MTAGTLTGSRLSRTFRESDMLARAMAALLTRGWNACTGYESEAAMRRVLRIRGMTTPDSKNTVRAPSNVFEPSTATRYRMLFISPRNAGSVHAAACFCTKETTVPMPPASSSACTAQGSLRHMLPRNTHANSSSAALAGSATGSAGASAVRMFREAPTPPAVVMATASF